MGGRANVKSTASRFQKKCSGVQLGGLLLQLLSVLIRKSENTEHLGKSAEEGDRSPAPHF